MLHHVHKGWKRWHHHSAQRVAKVVRPSERAAAHPCPGRPTDGKHSDFLRRRVHGNHARECTCSEQDERGWAEKRNDGGVQQGLRSQ